MKLHYTTGNEKTGIMSFNLLAGDKNELYSGYQTEKAKEITATQKVCGTCSGTCPGCYALKMTRYDPVYNNLKENTTNAKNDPVATVAQIEKDLFSNPFTAPRVFRIHDSGDFFSYEYFVAWVELIKRHPETIFGAYTKEKAIVEKYGIENIPDNFSLSCSPWKGHCDPIGNLPQFIYDDHTEKEFETLPHCPAVDKNGKRTGIQCINCLHCYTAKKGDKWAVYAH